MSVSPIPYNVQSSEEGGAGFVYSLTQSPAGASINPSTGMISWIPSVAQQGNQTFTVRASDGGGNTADQTFTVAVAVATEQPPVIGPIGNKSIDVEHLLTFVVTATDPGSPPEVLTFSLAAGMPTGATIDPTTGVFTWTPTLDQAGDHTITVRVTDGMLTTEQPFNVTVVPRLVTFQVINGDLVIPGTAGNDTVTIRGTNVAGRLMVNGTLGDQTVDGVTGAIRVEMGDGNDQITLDNVYVAGPIVLDMGNGSDVVSMGRTGHGFVRPRNVNSPRRRRRSATYRASLHRRRSDHRRRRGRRYDRHRRSGQWIAILAGQLIDRRNDHSRRRRR